MAEKLPWGLKSDGLAPASMKSITENKLKAFNIGTMNIKKGMTKKEQDDMKKKRDQEETEAAYKEFVDSFSNVEKGLNKTWVKGGLAHSGKGERSDGKKQLYKPKSRIQDLPPPKDLQQLRREEDEAERRRLEKIAMKKKMQEKKKSNLELFKEELKIIQEERLERRNTKKKFGFIEDGEKKSRFEPEELVASGASIGVVDDPYGKGAYNYDADLQTTNLYLGNINPKMSEQDVCELFGRFGPLASVKIMWPRSEEERARGRNCGFVAFMNRKDGERSLAALQGKEIMNFEMKLGWGKPVPIPPHPIYIPPALAELTLPPPPSGLPFNAQSKRNRLRNDVDRSKYGTVPPPGMMSQWNEPQNESHEKTLANAVVKVVIPTERNLLMLIHRMTEFVVREGPMFEAMIMNRELNNPMFRFLFENQSPAHVYYRWKMFTILQGDTPYKWRTDDFRMFKGGSMWRPPPLDPYTKGMPDALVDTKSSISMKKGQLTESQRDRLEDLLRELTPERLKVGDGMVWCLEHADAAEEIVECIAESLSILETPTAKKIARLFLISDILHNCSAKVPNASFFRKYFESKLPEIFKDIHEAYDKIDARLKAEQFKQKVMSCFRAWEDWAVYTNEYLIKLQNIFLGLVPLKLQEAEEEDVDGAPIEDVDGTPLDGAALELAKLKSLPEDDGIPMEDVDGVPLPTSVVLPPVHASMSVSRSSSQDEPEHPKGFKYEPSKWETVDESKLEAQAITTSKWDLLEEQTEVAPPDDLDGDDLDGQPMEDEEVSADVDSQESTPAHRNSRETSPYVKPEREMTEERRAKLREVEVKVMKYQDEVEAGKRSRKPEMSLADQVQQYRNKLLAKEEEKEREVTKDRWRKEDRDRVKEWERARDKERKREERVREERMREERVREERLREERLREERAKEDRLREREFERRDRDWEYDDVRRSKDERSYHGSERREQSPSIDDGEYTEPTAFKVYVSRSSSRSPTRLVRKAGDMSDSPLPLYGESSPASSRRKGRSQSGGRQRSKSPRRMSRSGSPRSGKPKRSRSRSISPVRHRHKHKKSKH